MNKYRIFIFLLLILGGIYYLYNKEESKDSVIDTTVAVMDEGDEKKIEDGGVDSDVIKNDDDVTVGDEGGNDTIIQKDEKVKATEPSEKDGDLIESDESAPMVIIENQSFTPYTNPATNYTINRPDNWYWQHLYITELTEVFPEITDLFVANRLPLEELESIYKSSIVIEVSIKDAAAVKEPVKNFDSKAVKIAEMDATRYEETRDDSEMIEYHLQLDNGKLIRFIYKAPLRDSEEVAIFEHIVSSFTF